MVFPKENMACCFRGVIAFTVSIYPFPDILRLVEGRDFSVTTILGQWVWFGLLGCGDGTFSQVDSLHLRAMWMSSPY